MGFAPRITLIRETSGVSVNEPISEILQPERR